jgi:predicted O-methyltransferase YrrM
MIKQIKNLVWAMTHGRGLDNVARIRARHADFDQICDEIRKSGTAHLQHFGNGYTHQGGLKLQQNPEEFAALCCLLREHAPHKEYLEIGSASGGACVFLDRKLRFDRVWSLDDGQHADAPTQEQTLAKMPHCHRFRGDSHSNQAREFMKTRIKKPLDVVWIDGDHSYKGVKCDVELVLPHCRPGGLLVFHDTYAWKDVKRAWRDTVKSRVIKPIAEYVGSEKPLGIGIGIVA